MNKVLLLGGSGILSSEICSLALKRGYSVAMINRGNRKKQINPDASLIIGDLKNEAISDLRNKLNKNQFDVVIDFVTYDVNQLIRSLELIKDICKHYIFVSSATVYLDRKDNMPFTEESPIGNTGWQYAYNKAKCEQYLQDNKKSLNFDITIIRPYITYGNTRIPYQVIPMSYYTLVNRILLNKPIPLFGDMIKCTLTTASEFAVGAVGLFLNPIAYGEAVHITADTAITWNEVIEELGCRLNHSVKIVNVPMNSLNIGSKKMGFDVDEIRYDKGRNMLFSNQKIKELVPEFEGRVKFADGIKASLDYYAKNNDAREIDYAWDARIDRLLSHYCDSFDIKFLNLKSYGDGISYNDKMKYILNRYNLFYYIKKAINKFLKIIEKEL